MITFGDIARIVYYMGELGKIYNSLEEEILALKAGGITPLKDAIIQANELFNEKIGDEQIMIIITDGEPTDLKGQKSYIIQNEILQYANTMKQSKNIKIICVGVGHDVNEAFLQKLASDGNYLFISSTDELKDILLASRSFSASD